MNTLTVGCGKADITPTAPTSLSGFIARRNQPFMRVEDPLYVRLLVLEEGGQRHFLLNYELLGFGPQAREDLLSALENSGLPGFARERCVITTTHTHSGPAVSPIEGESGAGPAYLDMLARQTIEAAHVALDHLRPASLHLAARNIEGLTYNRRALLPDGRVSMAQGLEMKGLERGPLDHTLTLLVWKDESETGHTAARKKNSARNSYSAVIVNFACHGVALLTPAVSGDIPGQIIGYMEEKFGAPCLFLQGPCGDVNPVAVAGERPAMLAWRERFVEQVAGIENDLQVVDTLPVGSAPSIVPIDFCPLPPREEVETNIRALDQIATGDFSALQAAETVGAVANLLNIRPGDNPDPVQASFTAMALANAERGVLRAVEAGKPLDPCPLNVTAWRVGAVTLVFIGAEVFSITGQRLRAFGGSGLATRYVLPVAYAAPVIGYIPDADSMRKGGYESRDAWRFYGQPAPFAPDSEERVLQTAQKLVAQLV